MFTIAKQAIWKLEFKKKGKKRRGKERKERKGKEHGMTNCN